VRIHVENLLLNFCCVFVFRYFHLIFCSSDERTALYFAAEHGHTAACQLLISAKADVTATDECAFMLKICYRIFFVFLFFSLLSDFLFQSPTHRSASRCLEWSHGSLPAADFSGSWRECDRPVRFHVQDLLSYHLIFRSRFEFTALHFAAEQGHTAACQLLIAAKADVNATDQYAFVFKICYWIFVAFCFSFVSSDFSF
jgi:hypothetical protein